MADDLTAFANLVDTTHRPVRAYVASLGLAPEAVDDVAQETYLDYLRSGCKRAGGAPELDWLLGMARHRALNHLRAERRAGRARAQLAAWLTSAPGGFVEEVDEALAALRVCLEGIDHRARRLLDAVHRDGLDAAAAGAREGLTGNAVRVALARLRERLRACIRQRLDGAL